MFNICGLLISVSLIKKVGFLTIKATSSWSIQVGEFLFSWNAGFLNISS